MFKYPLISAVCQVDVLLHQTLFWKQVLESVDMTLVQTNKQCKLTCDEGFDTYYWLLTSDSLPFWFCLSMSKSHRSSFLLLDTVWSVFILINWNYYCYYYFNFRFVCFHLEGMNVIVTYVSSAMFQATVQAAWQGHKQVFVWIFVISEKYIFYFYLFNPVYFLII